MRYRNKFICLICLLPATILNAQMDYETLHVKNAIIKGIYELNQNGFYFDYKGHTISIDGKTYPFYMRIEYNSSIRKWVNPLDTAGYEPFLNMDFILEFQNKNHKHDLYISCFEYGYDANSISSCGSWYYANGDYKKMVASYYFSGEVILYHLCRRYMQKETLGLPFILKNMSLEKDFVIVKEADKLDYLPKEVARSIGLTPSGIRSIRIYLEE